MTEVVKLSEVSADDFPLYWFDIARESHFWFKARLRAFLSFAKRCKIDFSKPLNVLEIGCGNGLVRKQLELRSNWKIDGCDIQIEALKENPPLKGKTYLYNIHDRRSEMKGAYDMIILFDVLEHIDNTELFLESVLFHLKPGGRLILNVPALNRLRGKYDEAVGHIRRYDVEMMKAEFASHAVEVERQRYWALFLVPLLWIREKRTPGNLSVEQIVKKGMEPPSSWVNALMDFALRAERIFFQSPPIGASLLTCVRKLEDGTKETKVKAN